MPKKGKKGGSGNLSKMTEEQRIIYEEELKREEENMKKKQEQTLTQYLKMKLQKEEKAAKLNTWKLNHQWRNIMRELKSKDLRKDIEILSQTFERIVDRKDSVLKSLVKDLNESEEQYLVALRSHVDNMDLLIRIHDERVTNLKNEYDEELKILKEEFDSERDFMIDQHKNQMDDLKDILVAFDTHYTNKENEALSEFSNLVDEIKNKTMEERESLRNILEKKVNDLWTQYQQENKNYNDLTKERLQQLEELKEKDKKSTEIINDQMKKIKKLSNKIADMKSQLGVINHDYDEKNNHLRDEKDRLVCQFQQMKTRMNQLRDLQRDKLTSMSLESNNAMKKLNSLIEKAERILKFGEMCRKLETEEEKVLPFYASSLTSEEENDVKAAMSEPTSDEWVELMRKYTNLENFWKRFNKVKLDRLAAEKERNMLADENAQLRNLLKQYLDGVSVNPEVIQGLNPLLVVNGRTNVNLENDRTDPRVKPVPTVMLEAAHIVKYNVTSGTLFK